MKGKTAKVLLTVLLVTILPHLAFAVSEEWVARADWAYTGQASAIAVDAGGSVYVTGGSGWFFRRHDYYTIKYDTTGNEVWDSRYDGSGVGDGLTDIASAIALDGNGNVYVTGYSRISEDETDYATIKYDPNGDEVWVARYDGSGGPPFDNDRAAAIAVDALGNVYVTGYSRAGIPNYDYATIKYDANGNEQWVVRYDHDVDDKASALVIDGAGNVYVTGKSFDSENAYDYLTIKYDTNGNEVWLARYDGPEEDASDEPNAIALDGDGNVYVTGGSEGVDLGQINRDRFDYATIKYDSSGNQIWAARYNNVTADEARAIAVDESANVYVTGFSANPYGGAGPGDYATIKYDPNGNEVWVARYDGADGYDHARALAIDGDGNVYVTGGSEGDDPGAGGELPASDYATVKYDPSGNEVWVARYVGPSGEDIAYAIALDSNDNVCVTGKSFDSGADGSQYVTVKYSQVASPVIDRIGGTKQAGKVIKIIGSGFGETQGNSVLHIGSKIFYSTSSRIKLWSDSKIRFRLPFTNKPCSWFKHGDGEYRKRKVWVTVGGVDSNIKRIRVQKPDSCL